MKTMITFLFVMALALLPVRAHNTDKYTEAMQKNIQSLYAAQTIADLQQAVNAIDRIAAAEKTKWEPYYYTSLGYVFMSSMEKDGARKDAYLDLATTSLEKAKVIIEDHSEVVALQGFVYMMRITVDPATRGQQYAGLATQYFDKAVALDAANPRALALLAQMQYGSAQFFHASTDAACATAKSALEKFATFKAGSPLAPQWGRSMAEKLVEACE